LLGKGGYRPWTYAWRLQVPGRGLVAGVLLYYPFVNEAETLPLEASSAHHVAVTTYNLTQARRSARAPAAAGPPAWRALLQHTLRSAVCRAGRACRGEALNEGLE